MLYILLFLEGVISFISPCLLPMLPVYISYFAGENTVNGERKVIVSAFGFIIGFTLIFILLGAFAGLSGRLLTRFQTQINIVTGGVVVLFGLHYLGFIKTNLFPSLRSASVRSASGFFPAMLLGIVFSVSWTPCVGAFLGSALLLASQQDSSLQGILMLLCYSIGLGVPFLLSAVMIDKLKTLFTWIKTHYRVINAVSGLFLVAIGILMMTGRMGSWIRRLS
ncbi:MAG: cytochrome c biogenesis protein CcdA [Clostridiales bacterium]|nr:cytochrome c biogenesis protein CcdA [Clostridiales bacterium]